MYLFTYSIYLFIYSSIYLFIYVFIHLFYLFKTPLERYRDLLARE